MQLKEYIFSCIYCFGIQGPDINNFHYQELYSSVSCILQQVVHKDQITSIGRCSSNFSESYPSCISTLS